MDFDRWLRIELDRRGWSRSELAERIGVSPAAVSRWVSGQRVPDEASCRRIASTLNVSVDAVLTRAGHVPATELRRQELEAEIDRLAGQLDELRATQEALGMELAIRKNQLAHLDELPPPQRSPLYRILAAIDEARLTVKKRDFLLREVYRAFGEQVPPEIEASSIPDVFIEVDRSRDVRRSQLTSGRIPGHKENEQDANGEQ